MGRKVVPIRQVRVLREVGARWGEPELELWRDVRKEETSFGKVLRLAHSGCSICNGSEAS